MNSLVTAVASDPCTEDVWKSFRRHIRSTIARQVHSPEDVDDLLQDVFTRIHRGIGDLRTPETLVRWLGQITHHTLVDYYRKKSSTPEMLPIDGLTTPGEGNAAIQFDEQRQTQRLFDCIAPMIDTLPETYREAFTLVERDGLSQREAAERLKISLPALKSRVQRGRKKLRTSLEQCCQFEFDSRGKLVDCHSCP